MAVLKQIIVMRRDLHMRFGKGVVQGAHAAMLFMVDRWRHTPAALTSEEREWFHQGMPTVCLRVESEQELLDIIDRARSAGLQVHSVTDAGKTEFHGDPTLTCCAIGPHESARIDPVTGHLRLF